MRGGIRFEGGSLPTPDRYRLGGFGQTALSKARCAHSRRVFAFRLRPNNESIPRCKACALGIPPPGKPVQCASPHRIRPVWGVRVASGPNGCDPALAQANRIPLRWLVSCPNPSKKW